MQLLWIFLVQKVVAVVNYYELTFREGTVQLSMWSQETENFLPGKLVSWESEVKFYRTEWGRDSAIY